MSGSTRSSACRAAVDVLLGKANQPERPLTLAARSNRVEYVRLLLGAGAAPATELWAAPPLENAIYHDNTQVVDLLVEHGIVPQALWTYAACGRVDLVRACFDADGRLRPGAASSRPDLADAGAGFPARLSASDDAEEIVGEAFVHACQHDRIEVVRWFLDRGVHLDVTPYLGRTGPHWAIPGGHVEVVRLLLERGADPSIREDLFHIDADGWLRISHAAHPQDPVTQHLHDLLEARSR